MEISSKQQANINAVRKYLRTNPDGFGFKSTKDENAPYYYDPEKNRFAFEMTFNDEVYLFDRFISIKFDVDVNEQYINTCGRFPISENGKKFKDNYPLQLLVSMINNTKGNGNLFIDASSGAVFYKAYIFLLGSKRTVDRKQLRECLVDTWCTFDKFCRSLNYILEKDTYPLNSPDFIENKEYDGLFCGMENKFSTIDKNYLEDEFAFFGKGLKERPGFEWLYEKNPGGPFDDEDTEELVFNTKLFEEAPKNEYEMETEKLFNEIMSLFDDI